MTRLSAAARTAVGGMVLLVCLSAAAPARAGDTRWQLAPPAAGDWFDDANWDNSTPTGFDNAFIDNGGEAVIATGTASAKVVNIGFATSGTVTQTGGKLGLSFSVSLGHDPTGAGTYRLSGGKLTGEDLIVGGEGVGAVIQTGGKVGYINQIRLGGIAGGVGSYELSGPGLIDCGAESVGAYGEGTFIHSGGTNHVNALVLGSFAQGTGTYVISGGALDANLFRVGSVGRGAFEIASAAASISVSGLLSFGPVSTFSAAADTTIRMTGSDFENKSTTPADLAGLGNLKLIFEGGPGAVDDVEVAGADLGPAAAGWQTNFELGTLQLGGAAAGRIKLVDDTDNQADGAGNEALYVGELLLDGGAALDPNALKLYYLNGGGPKQFFNGDANLDGAVNVYDLAALANNYDMAGKVWAQGDFTGDGSADVYDLAHLANNYGYTTGAAGAGTPVPEPAALPLLALALAAVARRRRR